MKLRRSGLFVEIETGFSKLRRSGLARPLLRSLKVLAVECTNRAFLAELKSDVYNKKRYRGVHGIGSINKVRTEKEFGRAGLRKCVNESNLKLRTSHLKLILCPEAYPQR